MLLAHKRARQAAICALVLLALALRLHHIGFGLPSLYDPDEPIFMVLAAKLLAGRTLNPGWFGPPGSTTIYLIALIDAAVYTVGAALGRFSSVAQFIHAAYSDPSLLFLPARIAMALLGSGCVALTYLIGKRVRGSATGLIAAALLALNALHIAWSQVIRTDVHASLFMLGAVLFALRFAEDGRLRDLTIAALLTGFGIATKWPAATAAAALIGAVLYSVRAGATDWPRALRLMALSALLTIAGLFIASPFIFLDFPTVLSNLSGEARPFHLGHTGGGFVANLIFYMRDQAAASMGWTGVLFVVVGVAAITRSRGRARFVVLPAALAFLIVICAQKLVWSRWLVPEMPFLCLFAAVGIAQATEWLGAAVPAVRKPIATALVAALALIPATASAVGQANERENDTRTMAADWIVRNAPPGSTIALEHLELRLRDRPYRFLFPMGSAGCVDALRLLEQGVPYDQLQEKRGGNPIVDLGTVSPARAESCRANFVILSYYDLYRREQARYPQEMATYSTILAGGRTVALFRPRPGRSGGPVVRIVAVPNPSPKLQ
ncbi:MAG TPA: glycosyltransferase family 39 protein [Sphingomicrobium sp.]|nr:glycosyltransferase family 39 protein [Sphingomicrobium sp.]